MALNKGPEVYRISYSPSSQDSQGLPLNGRASQWVQSELCSNIRQAVALDSHLQLALAVFRAAFDPLVGNMSVDLEWSPVYKTLERPLQRIMLASHTASRRDY